MRSILDEISHIRKNDDFEIDYNNMNRYRVVINENDGSKTAYYFSCPIYNNKSRKIIDFEFNSFNGKIYTVGSSSNITLHDTIRMENNDGFCEIQPPNPIVSYSKEKVCYGLDEIYRTTNGIAYKAVFNKEKKSTLFVKVGNSFLNVRATGKYFALMDDQFTPFITVSCIGVIDKFDNFIATAKLEYEVISNTEYKITIVSNENNGVGVLFEVNLYERKLFQDTTVESKNPNENNAFGSVAYIGRTTQFGEQWLYSRVDFDRISELIDKQINKIVMHIPLHNRAYVELNVFKIPERFCSFGSTWDNKITAGDLATTAIVFNGCYTINLMTVLTDPITKKLIHSNGLIIKPKFKDKGFSIISTADSSFAPQILEVNYR